MLKKVLMIYFLSIFLLGCDSSDESPPVDVEPPVGPDNGLPEEPPMGPDNGLPEEPNEFTGILMSSGLLVIGDVYCAGHLVSESAQFPVSSGEYFSCLFGAVELGQFMASKPGRYSQEQRLEGLLNFDIAVLEGANATKVLNSIDQCPQESTKICLAEINSFDISIIYQNLDDDEAVEEFLRPKEEDGPNNIGSSPSSHVDLTIVPEVSSGTSADLDDDFISANAESTYQYQPNSEHKVPVSRLLTDLAGIPLAGIDFYSVTAKGRTDANGRFETLSGEEITFGIDTYNFGGVSGNQLEYMLADVADNQVVRDNIQSFIERYASTVSGIMTISEHVHQVFANYPNEIQEAINLALPNGAILDGTEYKLPNDFEQQFSYGIAKKIDAELRHGFAGYSGQTSRTEISFTSTSIIDDLNKIFNDVPSFHVFPDSKGYYGATGYTRGMRALNISNRAYPIMMPRNDINRSIPLGEPEAWTREGKPHFARHPDDPEFVMPEIPIISGDNITFGLPFVSHGMIGAGRVVFMGNAFYPSILSCPLRYSSAAQLQIDSGTKQCTTNLSPEDDPDFDQGSMAQFFNNLFQHFNEDYVSGGLNAATNIETARAIKRNSSEGIKYSFFVNSFYHFASVEQVGSGSFNDLTPETTPILILQAYPSVIISNGKTSKVIADVNNPNLTSEDVTALIEYVHQGGNILFMDAIEQRNPEPIARLTDAAGVVLGGENVTPTEQLYCGSSYYCPDPKPNLHKKGENTQVVYERFPDVNGKPPYTINDDGSVEWIDTYMPALEIPTYTLDGQDKRALILVKSPEDQQAGIAELQQAFPGVPLCIDEYEYEFGCIEQRSGHGSASYGNYHRPVYERYPVNEELLTSMVKAANLGDAFTGLYQHEIYYRSLGKAGLRLSSVELNQLYDNLSVWMWNDEPFAYDASVSDEFGFETVVKFLNCYTNDLHGGEGTCPLALQEQLITLDMLGENGDLSPSYPLNYMEKPLTRIMLGRSYWDLNISVDTEAYPRRPSSAITAASVDIFTEVDNAVHYSAGAMQSTGLWAPQRTEVSLSGGVPATIIVALTDDLTGLSKHETALMRPPRVQNYYDYDGSSMSFTVPYGGLIYIKPLQSSEFKQTFTFNGVMKAAWWKEGAWMVSPAETDVPLAEIDSGHIIYTTPLHNVSNATAEEMQRFADDLNFFANAASDFHGRDAESVDGSHRRFTYSSLLGHRHRYVMDQQISIGSQHSGYPVMSSSFNPSRDHIALDPLDAWGMHHEFGHNLAAKPFNVPGSAEVTNNLLALYMQELRLDNPKMTSLEINIQKAPLWLSSNPGHPWSHADAGLRLVMFGQLKIWAETEFDIGHWYADELPSVYGTDNGWNLFKLMHRKARGEAVSHGETNYCVQDTSALAPADLLMLCASYISGYDLTTFFETWNPGESSSTNVDGTKVYSGGISHAGSRAVKALKLPAPRFDPLTIDSID